MSANPRFFGRRLDSTGGGRGLSIEVSRAGGTALGLAVFLQFLRRPAQGWVAVRACRPGAAPSRATVALLVAHRSGQEPAPVTQESHSTIRIRGARQNNLPQSGSGHPARRDDRHHRGSGFRQVRRWPSTPSMRRGRGARRVGLELCTPVPGAPARPDVDAIYGLTPAVAIQQTASARSARSTLGTATEVHDYLRLLFARLGTVHCARCQQPVRPDSPTRLAGEAASWPEGRSRPGPRPASRSRRGLLGGTGRSPAPDRIHAAVAQGRDRSGSSRFPRFLAGPLLQGGGGSVHMEARGGATALGVLRIRVKRGEGRLEIVRGGRPPEGSQRALECATAASPPWTGTRAVSFTARWACAGVPRLRERPGLHPRAHRPDSVAHPCVRVRSTRGRAVVAENRVARLEKLSRERGVPLDVPWRKLSTAHPPTAARGGRGLRASSRLERLKQKSYKAGNRLRRERYRAPGSVPLRGGPSQSRRAARAARDERE